MQMKRKTWKNIFTLTSPLLVAVWLQTGCAPKTEIQKQTRFLMDTYCIIQIPGDVEVLKAIEAAFDRMEEVDKHFNVLDSTNSLFRFNQNSEPITDKEIIALVETSLQISNESEGAFDITIYPLIERWGFFSDTPSLPDKKEIQQYLQRIGYSNLVIEDGTLTKRKKNVQIDLGGIAKGYAIKEALQVLKNYQIESALIDAGGDIYALGELDGKPWKVGVRNPRGEGVIGVLEVTDMAVVTSGDYERFFEVDGEKYHHLLDPKTGYPTKGLASVTVMSSDPVLADAWSTALFIMGKEKGMPLVEKKNDLKTIMITSEEEIVSSSNLE
jgi:thiamine biosynthesis lipoprotein